MHSTSQHLFASNPSVSIQRSKFRTPMTYKTAFDSGLLIPFYVDEALPGDTFSARITSFARLATPIAPFMDNLYLDFHYFAVPIRLLWDNFTRMMGERRDPEDSIDFLAPVMTSGENGFGYDSMMDYMGIPPNVPNLSCSSLWCRAYNMIWNEFFRDTRLQQRVPQVYDDGPDDPSQFVLLPRGKRHDYFTSCLPWPQEGPGVQLPLSTSQVPVFGDGPLKLETWDTGEQGTLRRTATTAASLSMTDQSASGSFSYLDVGVVPQNGPEASSGLYAELGNAAMVTINSLRQAFQIQRLLEKDARGGDRFVSILQTHFGVVNPDARMQRPEYLGGSSQPIQVHSVAQTSATDDTSPQGNLAAFGVSAGQNGFSKSFTEHCVLIGLVSVRADLTYQQGLPRMFSRRSRYDWYWPVLANLGEQAVLNKEIFAQGANVTDPVTGQPVDDQVFGYQERWAEYRYGVSKITGRLRSDYPQPLDSWHLAQHFTELPKLNAAFIQDKPPLKRVLAVQDEPEIIFDSNIVIDKVRPMPLYSIPGLMDHF